jgi:hypothetical protein
MKKSLKIAGLGFLGAVFLTAGIAATEWGQDCIGQVLANRNNVARAQQMERDEVDKKHKRIELERRLRQNFTSEIEFDLSVPASYDIPKIIEFKKGIHYITNPIKVGSNTIVRGQGMRETILIYTGKGNAFDFNGISGEKSSLSRNMIPGERILPTSTKFMKDEIVLIADTPDFANPNAKPQYHWQIFRVTGENKEGVDVFPRSRLRHSQEKKQIISLIPVRNSGIENLTLEMSSDNTAGIGINFDVAYNCWVKNVELSHSRNAHIWVERSKSLLFQGNYIHHGHGYREDSPFNGYSLVLAEGTSDCIVSNNVFNSLRHSFVVKNGANGNIFSYNFSFDPQPKDMQYGSCDWCAHGGYPYMNLAEGNHLALAQSSDNFGQAGPLQTFLRNRFSGLADNRGVVISLESHFPRIIGNAFMNSGIFLQDTTFGAVVVGNWFSVPAVNLPEKVHFGATRCYLNMGTQKGEVPRSLYLEERPEFLPKDSFPFNPKYSVLPAEEAYRMVYSKWTDRAIPLQK